MSSNTVTIPSSVMRDPLPLNTALAPSVIALPTQSVVVPVAPEEPAVLGAGTLSTEELDLFTDALPTVDDLLSPEDLALPTVAIAPAVCAACFTPITDGICPACAR